MKDNLFIQRDVDISSLTSLKIGCIVKYFVEIVSISHLKRVLKFCKNNSIKNFVLGNGTNVLVGNAYYDGMVIKFGKKFSKCKVFLNRIYCQSGANLFEINKLALKHKLAGMEFSYGIPGSVGGAIITNAGAFGGEMSDVVSWVKVLNNGKVKKYKNIDCGFGYRKSKFDNCFVLKIKLKLKKGNKKEIEKKMNRYLQKRKQTQPYGAYSCGSVFKRKDDIIVSRWIDEMGLKGLKKNDAMVSTKHAGFIVNNGKATCQDFIYLVKYIKNLFYSQYNQDLELEIKTYNLQDEDL